MNHRKHWKLAEICVAAFLMLGSFSMTVSLAFAYGQTAPATPIPTTTVQDTVYRADGTAAGGTVLISWPAFTTATGRTVAAGSTSVTLGAGGTLSVPLVANSGSTPMGSYYTVVFHLNDGTETRSYWVVPVSAYPVQVSAISTSVLPASVAMQTVSKAYVDNAIASAASGTPLDSSPYVLKAGDTMTGCAQPARRPHLAAPGRRHELRRRADRRRHGRSRPEGEHQPLQPRRPSTSPPAPNSPSTRSTACSTRRTL